MQRSLFTSASVVLLACSSGTSATTSGSTDYRQPTLAQEEEGPPTQPIPGAYELAKVVSGQGVWRQLNLVADGTFNGFVACRVPVCAQIRTFGAWQTDSDARTLTLTPMRGAPQVFQLKLDWDGRGGIEISDGADDVQLSYYAATCSEDADCQGKAAQGGDQTCGDGDALRTSCATNVCVATCVQPDTTPDGGAPDAAPDDGGPSDTPPVAQRGEHCGGFIRNAPVCADGLVCILEQIPDTGGTCEPEGTPRTCSSSSDCLEGQSCFFSDGKCGGAGRCQTPPATCDSICSSSTTVCACDGASYCNACLARRAGASLHACP